MTHVERAVTKANFDILAEFMEKKEFKNLSTEIVIDDKKTYAMEINSKGNARLFWVNEKTKKADMIEITNWTENFVKVIEVFSKAIEFDVE